MRKWEISAYSFDPDQTQLFAGPDIVKQAKLL